MKVKALIDIVGYNYDLKAGETADLPTETAKLLIDFNHAEEVKTVKKSKETKVTE